MSKEREIDPILEGLTSTELKDSIVNCVKQIAMVKEDLKNYSKASKEVIKEKEDRIEECLHLLILKESVPADG